MGYHQIMFDFHAHHGDDDENAYINIVEKSELGLVGGNGWLSIGTLPWIENIDADTICGLLEEHPFLGVGEIGLDRRFGDKEEQKRIFCFLCKVAKDMDRVLSVHCVGRTEEALQIIKKIGVDKVIFHGFNSSYEVAKKIVQSNCFISLGPGCIFLRDYQKITTLPFLIESDMKTGIEQKNVLNSLYAKLKEDSKRDVEKEAIEIGRLLWKGNF